MEGGLLFRVSMPCLCQKQVNTFATQASSDDYVCYTREVALGRRGVIVWGGGIV